MRFAVQNRCSNERFTTAWKRVRRPYDTSIGIGRSWMQKNARVLVVKVEIVSSVSFVSFPSTSQIEVKLLQPHHKSKHATAAKKKQKNIKEEKLPFPLAPVLPLLAL